MAESGKVSKDEGKHNRREKAKEKCENVESDNTEAGGTEAIPECAVCLQTCVHPARLPCSHIFCFLCLKGLATQSRRCAMCRQDIPPDYVDHPDLLEVPGTSVKEAFEDGYQWFYEGRSGWWQYEERISSELETFFKLGHTSCEILICGTVYFVDFVQGWQSRKDQQGRKRRIKRDLASAPKKGIAGWWQYDERTSRELEAAYKSGLRTCELLIVGQLYIADFDAMLQLRRNDMSRRRRIKRDLASIPIKGIAGLRLDEFSGVLEESIEGIHRPSTSQQVATSRSDGDQSSSQTTQSKLYCHQGNWRASNSNVIDSDDDVESEENRDEDTTDLELGIGFAEDRECEDDENDCYELQAPLTQTLDNEENVNESDDPVFQLSRFHNL